MAAKVTQEELDQPETTVNVMNYGTWLTENPRAPSINQEPATLFGVDLS